MALKVYEAGRPAEDLPPGAEPPTKMNIQFLYGLKLVKLGGEFIWVPATAEEAERFSAEDFSSETYEDLDSRPPIWCRLKAWDEPGTSMCIGECREGRCTPVYNSHFWNCACV